WQSVEGEGFGGPTSSEEGRARLQPSRGAVRALGERVPQGARVPQRAGSLLRGAGEDVPQRRSLPAALGGEGVLPQSGEVLPRGRETSGAAGQRLSPSAGLPGKPGGQSCRRSQQIG